MANYTNTHKMTGVGNALKRHYQALCLDYELAHPEDLTKQVSRYPPPLTCEMQVMGENPAKILVALRQRQGLHAKLSNTLGLCPHLTVLFTPLCRYAERVRLQLLQQLPQ